MTTRFDEDWLTGTGAYLDDVLWPAVVERSDANSECSAAQREAAWEAYCDDGAGGDGAVRLRAFIEAAETAEMPEEAICNLVANSDLLDSLVEHVNQAIAAAEGGG